MQFPDTWTERLPIHEGGHLLFRFFGEFLNIAGGILMRLGVPAMLATHSAFQREAQGTAFCGWVGMLSHRALDGLAKSSATSFDAPGEHG